VPALRQAAGCHADSLASLNRPYARKIKLAEFGIKKSGSKKYLENPKGKPGNPGVQEKSWVFTREHRLIGKATGVLAPQCAMSRG